MSLPVACLECDRCGALGKLGPYPAAYYLTEKDGPLPVRWALGWCAACEAPRRLEDWPHAAALDEEELPLLAEAVEWQRQKREAAEQAPVKTGWLSRLLSRGDKAADAAMPEKMPHALELADLSTYRKLMQARQSTNRCMDCGSTHVWHWDLEKDPHPEHLGCGGRFQRSAQDSGMRLSYWGMAELFGLEGLRLGTVQTSERRGRPTADDLVAGLRAAEGDWLKAPKPSIETPEKLSGPNNAREAPPQKPTSPGGPAAASGTGGLWPRLVDFDQSEDGFNQYLTAWISKRRRTPLLNQIPMDAVREHRGAMAFAREMGWQEREEE